MGQHNGRHTCTFCNHTFYWNLPRGYLNLEYKGGSYHILCPHCKTFEDGEKYVPEPPSAFDLMLTRLNEVHAQTFKESHAG